MSIHGPTVSDFALFGPGEGPGNGTALRSFDKSAQNEASAPFPTRLLTMAYWKGERLVTHGPAIQKQP